MKVVEPVKWKPLTKKQKLKQIAEGIKQLQKLSGITVTRKAIVNGIFPKPYHIFYVASSVSGVEIRYEIETDLEKDLGQAAIIQQVIKNFPKHANKVN